MSALNCHVPARIRIAGSPTQETWDALETALARHYARSIRRGLDAMGNARVAAARADARELHSPAREHPQGYLIPSYQGFGQPEPVAMDAGAAVAAPPSLSGEEAIEAIRRHYGGLEGAEGGRLGIYARIGEGMLQLHVAMAGPDGKVRLQGYRLFVERGAEQMPARLEPGTYHMVLRAGLSGHLYRGGRVVSRWRNPENYDLSVNFLVPQEDGIEEVVVRGRGPRFFARLSGIVALGPDEPAAGATRSYRAGIEIWREDEAGAFTLVPGLALIYASVTYEWTISRIEKGPAGEVRTPIRTATTDIAFLTHVWEKPGDYDVACTVGLKDRAASPVKAIEHLREKVLDPDIKLARELAQLEAAEEQLGASIWLTPQAAIAALEKRIEDAKADPAGNEALIQALEKLLADARHRLGDGLQRTASRLRAVFIERRTSQVMPLALYLAPLKVDLVDPVRPHRWRLVDLTYPAFYASFEGSGATVREAILAAFEAGRTSLRATYPPGEILASIDFPELATYGISPFSVTIETESWQRTAFEWLSFGAQVAGGLALTASLVFPPTSVAVGALVLGQRRAGDRRRRRQHRRPHPERQLRLGRGGRGGHRRHRRLADGDRRDRRARRGERRALGDPGGRGDRGRAGEPARPAHEGAARHDVHGHRRRRVERRAAQLRHLCPDARHRCGDRRRARAPTTSASTAPRKGRAATSASASPASSAS